MGSGVCLQVNNTEEIQVKHYLALCYFMLFLTLGYAVYSLCWENLTREKEYFSVFEYWPEDRKSRHDFLSYFFIHILTTISLLTCICV